MATRPADVYLITNCVHSREKQREGKKTVYTGYYSTLTFHLIFVVCLIFLHEDKRDVD